METDNKMMIMIVEDDVILSHQSEAFLEKRRYTARTAARLDAVMDEFDRIQLHLLLMDVILPCHYGLYCH